MNLHHTPVHLHTLKLFVSQSMHQTVHQCIKMHGWLKCVKLAMSPLTVVRLNLSLPLLPKVSKIREKSNFWSGEKFDCKVKVKG